MLTFKPMYSIIRGLSIIVPLVLPPPHPQGYSPPSSFVALLYCCGLPQLSAMLDGRFSTDAVGVFRCSAQELLDLCCHFTPGFIARTGSLGLLRRSPALCMGPSDPSLFIRTVLFPLCGLTGAPFILCFVCFTFVKC